MKTSPLHLFQYIFCSTRPRTAAIALLHSINTQSSTTHCDVKEHPACFLAHRERSFYLRWHRTPRPPRFSQEVQCGKTVHRRHCQSDCGLSQRLHLQLPGYATLDPLGLCKEPRSCHCHHYWSLGLCGAPYRVVLQPAGVREGTERSLVLDGCNR
jgi:hypothetical protein